MTLFIDLPFNPNIPTTNSTRSKRKEQPPISAKAAKVARKALEDAEGDVVMSRESTPPESNRPATRRSSSSSSSSSALVYAPIAPQKEVEGEIKIVNVDEFLAAVKGFKGDFNERMAALQAFSSPDGPSQHALWIEVNPKKQLFLKVVIEKHNALEPFAPREELLREYPKKSNPFYYTLSITESCNDEEEDIILFSISPNGVKADLASIGPGSIISGPDVIWWANQFKDALQLNEHIYDDEIKKFVPRKIKEVSVKTFDSDYAAHLKGDFKDRIETLYKLCSPISLHTRSVKINVSAKHSLHLLIEAEQKFESEAFTAKLLSGAGNFYKVSLYENDEKLLVKYIIAHNGKKAELSWIAKGDILSGNDAMAWAKKIEQLIGLQTIYLFDDARKHVNIPDNPDDVTANRLYIRLLDAFSDDDPKGLSWYERHGYGVHKCTNLLLRTSLDPKPMYITQDGDAYREAIVTIRNTTLNQFKAYFANDRAEFQKINALFKKYLPGVKNPTVHQLVAHMKAQTRLLKDDALTQVQIDLIALFNLIKNPSQKPEVVTPEYKAYEKATTDIGARVFVKII